MADYVERREFMIFKTTIEGEVRNLRDWRHDIANDIAVVKLVKETVERMIDDMKELPRRDDLDNMTRRFDDLVKSLRDEREAADRRLVRIIMAIGIASTAILTLAMIVINILKLGT